MAPAIAPYLFQKHGGVELAHLLIVNARLEGLSRDTEGLAAKLQHLRHEREILEASLLIQRRPNLRFREHFNQIAGQKPRSRDGAQMLSHRRQLS
jgi:hypothetical protein